MTEIELAYMAGLFDGEGCISITKVYPKQTNLHNASYGLTTRVSMVDKNIPEFFYSTFGGHLVEKKPRKSEEKLQWKWGACGANASICLRELLPYLRSKTEEAEIALNFWGTKRTRGGNKGMRGNLPKSKEEIAHEEAHYILVHK